MKGKKAKNMTVGWGSLVDDIVLECPTEGYQNATEIAKELGVKPLVVRRKMKAFRDENKVKGVQFKNPVTGYTEWYYKK